MSDELIELPEGWEWASVESIAKLIQYGTSAKTDEEPAGIPVLRMGNIIAGSLSFTNLKYLPKEHEEFPDLLLEPGDVLFNRTNSADLVGKTAVFEGNPLYCSFASYLIRIRFIEYSPKLFSWYVNSIFGRAWISNVVNQQVGQANVSGAKLKALRVPVPPHNEQKRIVAKIEELRSKTQKAREALEAVPEMCDRFRQSVLAAAFQGDLTADWREEHLDVEPAKVLLKKIREKRYEKWETKLIKKGKLPNQAQYKKPEPLNKLELPDLPPEWEWATVEELAETSLGKMLDKGKEKKGRSLPYLRNINIRWNHIDTSDVLEMYFDEDELERYSVKSGDVLICEGGEPGRAAVWTGDSASFKYQKALHRVRPFLPLEPLWLIYHLKFEASSGVLEQYFTGTTIKHFTGVALAKYPVRLPSLEEQKEVIFRIQSLFALVDNIQQQYEAAKARIEKLDRAILAKAFRGELVPQDPNDEPASVLLERIREGRAKVRDRKSTKRKRQN